MTKLIHLHVSDDPPLQLVGTAEIALLANVRTNTVNQWKKRGLMPAPIAELNCGTIWHKDQVVTWLKNRKA